jgi:hypothetical protein
LPEDKAETYLNGLNGPHSSSQGYESENFSHLRMKDLTSKADLHREQGTHSARPSEDLESICVFGDDQKNFNAGNLPVVLGWPEFPLLKCLQQKTRLRKLRREN